jgi:adenylyltransferase and sulfurtransferase
MVAVIDSLRQQIESCEATLRDLRRQLAEAELLQRQQDQILKEQKPLRDDPLGHDMNYGVPDDFRSEVFAALDQGEQPHQSHEKTKPKSWPLEASEYKRYGRQLIMPEIGLRGKIGTMKTLRGHC